MKHIHTIVLEGSIAQMRTRVAIEQGAMHQVQLSVARWRADPASKPELEQGPAMAASQAEWHAAAQCHFLCWLAGGGFAQTEEEESHHTIALSASLNEAADSQARAPSMPAPCHNCTA
ncbi:hypothetical protein [Janthinobacterium psychrotolerans]|uniref:Uncharacterized protein n=1 Tax=Janthinobacterium psychrotolerans TaxID=1747903 RepID=A0A1A7C6Z3_9BURK|nr:hypothetical protein [Janthinobacterium psychrotolerans]OBV40535.1 hypothetical protein ASR47_101735 [Janthinobacterium psychrotolerans]